MTISVLIGGKSYPAAPPYPTASFAEVSGWTCACGSTRVSGRGMSHDHDTYRAVGHCAGCGVEVGVIKARVSTLFGIEEDNAVLHGRPRVY